MKKLVLIGLLIIVFTAFLLVACVNVVNSYPNADKYLIGEGDISTEINDIDIDWISGNVIIEPYEGDSIKIVETASRKLTKDEEVRYFVDGTTLRIKFCKSGHRILGVLNKIVTLKVPADVYYSSIKTETVSANIDANALKANRVIFETVSGKVKISCNDVQTISAKTVSGGMEITSNSLETVAASSTSGKINITTKDASRIDASTVSGSVKLNIPFVLGYSLGFSTISGSLHNNTETTKDGNSYVSGNGFTKISVSTVSGSLTINGINE